MRLLPPLLALPARRQSGGNPRTSAYQWMGAVVLSTPATAPHAFGPAEPSTPDQPWQLRLRILGLSGSRSKRRAPRLSRRVGKIIGCPPLVEMDDRRRRQFHEALLDADSSRRLAHR
jgi:hypothetical protein